jgi:hypothetical protein
MPWLVKIEIYVERGKVLNTQHVVSKYSTPADIQAIGYANDGIGRRTYTRHEGNAI